MKQRHKLTRYTTKIPCCANGTAKRRDVVSADATGGTGAAGAHMAGKDHPMIPGWKMKLNFLHFSGEAKAKLMCGECTECIAFDTPLPNLSSNRTHILYIRVVKYRLLLLVFGTTSVSCGSTPVTILKSMLGWPTSLQFLRFSRGASRYFGYASWTVNP